MPRYLLLVESPSKARSIQKYLPSGWTVRATIGHICDLPTKEYGVDVSGGTFEETYVPRDPKIVADLKRLAHSGFDHIYLGTDPDREGEAISAHVVRELKLKKGTYSRVRFHSINKDEILRVLAAPDQINVPLVDAQRARRVLDRIVGFDVSSDICQPAGAPSAGRVQTPALHFICQREREISSFVPENYFTLDVTYREGFSAFVRGDEEAVAADANGEIGDPDAVAKRGGISRKQFPTREAAEEAKREAESNPHVVRDVQKKETKRSPSAPYTTADVLQDAFRKLGMNSSAGMKMLQELYEAGLITYHRTDSVRLEEKPLAMIRDHIAQVQPEALSPKVVTYRVNAQAQDGHEAIRPTSMTPNRSDIPKGGEGLYDMIVARTLASQCKPATFAKTTIEIDSGKVEWVAEGSVLIDPGFLAFWGPYARQEDAELPAISARQRLTAEEYALEQRSTKPPSRFSEGDMIQIMKRTGIGRPATYEACIRTLKLRGYVTETETKGKSKKTFLQATKLGLDVDDLMSSVFSEIVTPEYTASMEQSLDEIEGGALTRVEYLADFYEGFREKVGTAKPLVGAFCSARGLKPRSAGRGRGEETDILCDRCGSEKYRKVQRKTGRATFLACSCGFTRDVKAKTKKAGCKASGCGGNLVERSRKDKKGSFFACAKDGCNYIENVDGSSGGGRYTREDTEKLCPRCEKEKLLIFAPRDPKPGEGAFYACPDRERCGFNLRVGARPHRVKCQELVEVNGKSRICEGLVLEREAKNGSRYWECAKCRAKRPDEGSPPRGA